MTYNVYTLKRSIPVNVTYECSKCHKKVTKVQTVDFSDGYSTKGAWSQKEIDKRAVEAEQRLERKEKDLRKMISNCKESNGYYYLNLQGKCPHCGNAEPWSKFALPAKPTIIALSIVLALFSVYFHIYYLTALFALVAIGYPILDKIIKASKEKQLKNPDYKSLPDIQIIEIPDKHNVVAKYQAALAQKEAMEKQAEQTEENTPEPPKAATVEDGKLVCPKCGQKQALDRTTCFKCGATFE